MGVVLGMSNRATMPQVKYSVTPLGGGTSSTGVAFPGGLDQVTPALRLQPGAVGSGLNFECAQSGGYARIGGYERVDGRAAPSSAYYQVIQVASFANLPTVGQTVTQATSGATGVISDIVESLTNGYLTDDLGNLITDDSGDPIQLVGVGSTSYLCVTMVTGTFDTSHALTTPGPVAVGTAVPLTVSISAQLDAQYMADAADVYRAQIGAVPGSGPVLGVVGMIFAGVDNLYAFRANAGGTAVALYKTSAAGWVLVPFFNTLNFTAGSVQPQDGDTLTQGGVTATIKRVMWQSGAFAAGPGNTAAGTFVVTNPTGGNFASGAATTSSGGAITLSGVQAPITLLPGGSYEFTKCNFSGQLVTRRIYGCDGVNQAFEFDGTTYAPITTGLSPDQPSHITFHKNYLFIAQGSSILYPGVGTPFKWDAVDGGGEIATGDTVTNMLTLPGSQTTATLGIYMKSNVAFLYGTDPTTFNYVTFNTGLGALPRSAQNLFDTFAFDTLGVVTLRTTLNWGNFLPTTLTKNMLPFVLQERDKLTTSCIFREKSSYRLFFSDGYGLWVTMINQQYLGALPVLFPNPVACCDQGVTSLNDEVIFFGSNDGLGFVYQMEKGTSFDGAPISAYITMAWDALKSPRILKRFRAGSIEMQGNAYASIQFGYQLAYGSTQVGDPYPVNYERAFAAAPKWDSFTWDQFVWDGLVLAPTDVDMTGTAENVQVTLASDTNYIAPFTIDSLIYHYSMGRGIRV